MNAPTTIGRRHYGWDAERVKNLLQDRKYGLSIDKVNLAHQALSSLAAYEGLKSGEAELYREAHPNMLEWGSFSSVSQIGMGRFKKAWGRMKAWLQKQYSPDTATPPPGISHFRARALDTVGGPSTTTATGGGPSSTTTAATLHVQRPRLQSRARAVQEPAKSLSAQAYPSSPIATPALKVGHRLHPRCRWVYVSGTDADVVMVKAMPPPPTPTPMLSRMWW